MRQLSLLLFMVLLALPANAGQEEPDRIITAHADEDSEAQATLDAEALAALDLPADGDPLATARGYERAYRRLSRDLLPYDAAARLLEEALKLKEDNLGLDAWEVADTLMLLAELYERHDLREDPDHPRKWSRRSTKLRHRARDIRAMHFGESSCEVAEVDVLIAITEEYLGKPDRAERLYRSVIEICPPAQGADDDISGPHLAGLSANGALSSLLRRQGREDEAEELIQ